MTCEATWRVECDPGPTGQGLYFLACRHESGHDLPHHDPHAHWDWTGSDDGWTLVRDHTPYRCTWSQTRYADGKVYIWPDQPTCDICGTKAAGFNPGERWARA